MAQMLTFDCPSEEAVRWIAEALALADLQAATSFDLRTARAAHTGCSCPHHGTAACDCQMVVLLVYGRDACPATLVVHGRDGRTYLSLADTPGQRPTPRLAATIFTALTLDTFSQHQREVHANLQVSLK
jgi:hypothetical protein